FSVRLRAELAPLDLVKGKLNLFPLAHHLIDGVAQFVDSPGKADGFLSTTEVGETKLTGRDFRFGSRNLFFKLFAAVLHAANQNRVEPFRLLLRLFGMSIAAGGRRITLAREFSRYVGRRITLAAWSITGKEVVTKKGDPMEFVSFEDETAIFETTFFPKAYQRFCQILDMNRAYLLTGRVQEQYGTVSLNVEDVRRL
ncbi:MAG: hypothetical protein P8017_19090, partial [Deltaproteobacteria bacterium]